MVGASVGDRGLIYPGQLPALRNQNMWCFRAKPESFVSQTFVKYMLDSIMEKSLGLASGSAREFFRKGDFGKQSICVGTANIQKSFRNLVLPILYKQSLLNDEIGYLTSIRDSLLPKLLSGELSINPVSPSLQEAK